MAASFFSLLPTEKIVKKREGRRKNIYIYIKKKMEKYR
jgi:hypothetical protein